MGAPARGGAGAAQRPVAFLQFADFLPVAFNQLAAELATMHWRSAGGWQAPVIVMAACGGYRPGLGPYHAQTGEALLAHVPGLDIMMPADAADAAALLNAAFASARPTVFLYPKALLNVPLPAVDTAAIARLGSARKRRTGNDLTVVAWGNTVRIAEQAADCLASASVSVDLIDLRTLAPWDAALVLESVSRTQRLLVVHEDNRTCGLGAEVLATVAEQGLGRLGTRRVTRADTHVPCHHANHLAVLPSYADVMTAAAALLDLDLSWEQPASATPDGVVLRAIAGGPSDDTVSVLELAVTVGSAVAEGDLIAVLESDKIALDFTAAVAGVVDAIHAAVGDELPVGAPLVTLRPPTMPMGVAAVGRSAVHDARRASLGPRRRQLSTPQAQVSTPLISMLGLGGAIGGREVPNSAFTSAGSLHSAADIESRTGITSRRWLAAGESMLGLAAQATRAALVQAGVELRDIGLLICATTTPDAVTPSTACRLLASLSPTTPPPGIAAYDINAACSGYLYALRLAFDHLQMRPHERVLVVTAEVLSPLLDPHDFDTAIIFADACTATVLGGAALNLPGIARVHRPVIASSAESGAVLAVPFSGTGYIHMEGRKVFSTAVRHMQSALRDACAEAGVTLETLRAVVPHQANQRIIDALQSRMPVPLLSNIRHIGNTSSSSIPLALEANAGNFAPGDRVGLCAFGGGFTSGAAVLEMGGQRIPRNADECHIEECAHAGP